MWCWHKWQEQDFDKMRQCLKCGKKQKWVIAGAIGFNNDCLIHKWRDTE